ncbi:MAG: 5-(carboxyamino)imidazole ribonucleotide mutase [Deltaproteobacteria bacterium]|nr:5-(carboxyamino)imidazole ribonucleotide mutase [Deltaproteobacteria bacterium]MCL5792555.1 5-(carboxyamino)imidazole ribonucleotide mutase [Deltaproteobacteria bacterium]
MNKKQILIIIGSSSDEKFMSECVKILDSFHAGYEMIVSSAHRTPDKTRQLAKSAKEKGFNIIIAGAGGAAHLAGAIASETVLPVIGVPLPTSYLSGMDALLSTVQMPGGIPVATVAIGESGAKNAALLAIEILALNDHSLYKKLIEYRLSFEKNINKKRS